MHQYTQPSATSHYLSQWWPRSLSPYGVNRPQSVELMNSSFKISYVCLRVTQKTTRSLIQQNLSENETWASNFTSLFYMGAITNSCASKRRSCYTLNTSSIGPICVRLWFIISCLQNVVRPNLNIFIQNRASKNQLQHFRHFVLAMIG